MSTIKHCLLVVFFVVITTCMAACGGTNIAKQEDFLADMSNGLHDRLADPTTEAEINKMTMEEFSNYYKRLVNYELARIGKYSDKEFSNAEFGQLAHSYIDACKIQLSATDNYKNEDLFYSLWESGLKARSKIIIEMYEHYGLDISAEDAALYRDDNTNVSVNSSDLDALFNLFPGEIELQKGDLRITNCGGSISDSGSDYIFYDFTYTVENNTSVPLDIVLSVAIQDKNGNILGSSNASSGAKAPAGKQITLQGGITIKGPNSDNRYLNAYCIVPEAFSYDSDGDYCVSDLAVVDGDIKDYTIIIK